ncbi:MAG: zinc ribbon domain-containing protein [Pyrinomonadaceae bacterium]
MHCPNCGRVVNKSLKYCNDCGERLSKADEIDKDGTPGKMLDNILTTLFLVVMFGMGILVGLVAVMLGNNVRTEVVTTIVLAYLGAIFGICFMLARQVPKLIDARLKSTYQANEPLEPHQLRPLTTAQLEEFREPAMSVTDHTTKTLDKVPFK